MGLTLVFGALLALDPNLAVTQYAKKHWRVEDGLPQNYVSTIAQSSQGHLIVATSGGVARFDGIEFRPVVLDTNTGISREWINNAQTGVDGSLWIASRDAGLFHLPPDGKQPRRIHERSINHLIRLRSGKMLSLGIGGLIAWQPDTLSPRVLDSSLAAPDPAWQGLLELPGGQILVAANKGAFRIASLDTGKLHRLAMDAAMGKALTFAASATPHSYWTGTSTGLFLSHTEKLGESHTRIPGVPGPVVSIVEDSRGTTWAATWGHGLYRVRGGLAAKCADGVSDEFVHYVFEDREGNLWIGTRDGLSRWSSGPITPFGKEEGLAGAYFSSVTGSARGGLWFGTWRSGLYHRRAHGGLIERVPLPRPELAFLVRAMAAGHDGSLWLADWNSVYHYERQQWRLGPQVPGMGQPNTLAVDPAGELWIGATNGLFHGTERILAHPVHALLIAKTSIWAGTSAGLWRITNGQTQAIRGLPHPHVTSIQQDSQGRIWCTTKANGIVLIANGQASTYDQRHGLPPHPFYAAIDDGRGSLWLSSHAGIYEVPLSEIGHSRLTAVHYDQDDGMRSVECQSVGTPTAWKDPAGDLWFPTVRGMVRVRPQAKRRLPPPTVIIHSVTADSQGHTVRFASTLLSSPPHVEYRYRIDDKDWIIAGSSREVRYNGLSAGAHVLQVSARYKAGPWSTPAETVLQQQPRFYETWSFRIAFAAALASLLWAAYRWRMYLLHARYRAVLSERNRIGREWHDTLVAGFSAISWQLDSALKRMSNPKSAEEAIIMARTMVHHYRAEARNVIWDLRQNEVEIESLPKALERTLARLVGDRGPHWELHVDGDVANPLDGDLSQNLLRICQEAVSNAMQHARPSRISVRLRFDPGRISTRVEDDGQGFEPDKAGTKGHFGLAIMQERARRFGGKIEIESRPGNGTVVLVTLPYAGVS